MDETLVIGSELLDYMTELMEDFLGLISLGERGKPEIWRACQRNLFKDSAGNVVLEAVEQIVRALKESGASNIDRSSTLRKTEPDTAFFESGRTEGVEGGSGLTVDTSGLDWYNYFRDKYGKENVCLEECHMQSIEEILLHIG